MSKLPESLSDKPVKLIEHSLAQHKLTQMRDRSNLEKAEREKFRRLMREVGLILCCEVTRHLLLQTSDYSADPNGINLFQGDSLKEHRIVVIPIIRGGLVLAESFCELMPMALVGHIGLFREYVSGNSKVTNFFTSIPSAPETDFFLIDAEINTSNTITSAVEILLNRVGVEASRISVVSLVAWENGLVTFYNNTDPRFREVKIFTLAVDEELDNEGMVFPGLGNVGVRLFGTHRG